MNKNGFLTVTMTNHRFLKWLHQEFDVFSASVSFKRSAEQSAADWKAAGYDDTVNLENRKDIYRWRSRAHPFFTELREWYSSGTKRFPQSLSLTPTIVKFWYVCDGGLGYPGDRPGGAQLSIYNIVQQDQQNLLTELFAKQGFSVKWYDKGLYLPREETVDFLDWIGPAPPGFEYKWCSEDRTRYQQLKE